MMCNCKCTHCQALNLIDSDEDSFDCKVCHETSDAIFLQEIEDESSEDIMGYLAHQEMQIGNED